MTGGDLDGKRIGLLTASASRLGGGVAEAVAAQAAIIRARGGEAIVFALDDPFGVEAGSSLAPTPLVLGDVVGPRQVGYSPAIVARLIAADLDLLHLHGIWMYPSRAGMLWARHTGRPYLISPHGMLDPWITGRGRWKKALARRGYERGSWAAASLLHALTDSEAADIERETGRAEILVIPNPGPQPMSEPTSGPAFERRQDIVYLGRIHPKKNLAVLVAAWRKAPRPDGARLVIAGWGDPADVAALERLLAEAGDGSISFIGPAFGAAKQDLLGRARFMVLPSLSEGLPLAMLEAWAAATPTIMSEACHLPEGYATGAALSCGIDAESVAAALTRALAMTAHDWRAMAAAAQGLANGPFHPSTVASRWSEAYLGAMQSRAAA